MSVLTFVSRKTESTSRREVRKLSLNCGMLKRKCRLEREGDTLDLSIRLCSAMTINSLFREEGMEIYSYGTSLLSDGGI